MVKKLIAETVGYCVGLSLAILFWTLDKLGLLKVTGWERLPKELKKIIIVSNHPSLWEPLALSYLFCRQYVFDFKRAPYNLPDANNYYRQWFSFLWWPIRTRFIPVERNVYSVANFMTVYRTILKVLDAGGNLIIFPEGGRTSSVVISGALQTSSKGKKLRYFSDGAAAVALSAKAIIVPVWLDGFEKVLPRGSWLPRIWRRCSIKIGEPINAGTIQLSKNSLNRLLEKTVLALADE